MTDLPGFLLARIAEDEMQAEAVSDPGWLFDGFGCKAMARADTKLEYADRWKPSRVLAECDAKRRIVKELATTRKVVAELPSGSGRLAAKYSLDAVLRLLALAYADHPDYNEAWRP